MASVYDTSNNKETEDVCGLSALVCGFHHSMADISHYVSLYKHKNGISSRNRITSMCGTLIAQLIEHEIDNLRVANLNPALGTGRNIPPVHSAAQRL